MQTGKKFGTFTVRRAGRKEHRCQWTLHHDGELLVVVWISDTHIERQWVLKPEADTDLNETARNIAMLILGPYP
jgi:hypothetical protein